MARRGEEQRGLTAGQGTAKVWEGEVFCCSARGSVVRTWQGGLASPAAAGKEVALQKRRGVRAGDPETGKCPQAGPKNPQIL